MRESRFLEQATLGLRLESEVSAGFHHNDTVNRTGNQVFHGPNHLCRVKF